MDYEDHPKYLSMSGRRRFGYEAKHHEGDWQKYRNPARNYLKKNVGKEWNDVWADICEPRANKKMKEFLKKRIGFFVELHCEQREDGVYSIENIQYRIDHSPYASTLGRIFYVLDGVLCST